MTPSTPRLTTPTQLLSKLAKSDPEAAARLTADLIRYETEAAERAAEATERASERESDEQERAAHDRQLARMIRWLFVVIVLLVTALAGAAGLNMSSSVLGVTTAVTPSSPLD